MRPDILKRFLTNTDETGRFIMKSRITGIIYFVEPIYNGKTPVWGDVDPATKKLQAIMVQNLQEQLLKKNH